ncbi:MAG: hypothetical protein D6813_13905 [Calditrichaeota bacterium]|nr:MAG: hypothetical protein D6813_13905 [Calditrichota bacterium]
MPTYFLVLDKETNKVLHVREVPAVDDKEFNKTYYIFQTLQTPPKVGDVFNNGVDPRTYQEKRKQDYEKEVDHLLISYLAVKEAGEPQTEIDAAKNAWLSARNNIKARHPKA